MLFADGSGAAGTLNDPGLREMESVIRAMELGSRSDEVTVTGHVQENWQRFRSLFHHIEAAGGVVRNEQDRWLMIHRLGKWDLPKGKLENFEQPEEAAVREVSEECGIPEPELLHHLIDTYHIYTQHGERVLKRTYWYLMRSHGDHAPTPQTIEGITEVKWVEPAQVNLLAQDSYNSIRIVLQEAERKTGSGNAG